jgi:hypothetical protein
MLPVPIHSFYFMRYVYPAQLTQLIMRAQSLQLMESLLRSFHSKVYLYGNWEGVGGEGRGRSRVGQEYIEHGI